MDINKTAKDILEYVGGKENVKDVTHCFFHIPLYLA